ncbi:BfmA/BtgA family mobilization protein [Mucilaginibacter jinjuensis]|uniref:BfmA/BtgA family mobilization protein n=1 Tax=Mucilaginibacter jinjuensis TaxID=1176721 RepID=A0ABY7T5F2_9SPHI|nr:BfmA/BtgA family mobilization protein [Mucilaginibacter jinjuensis]WCT11018.1 BfmA/BtgA family mobilization protein [Mucilaginibacter jinjuensis]
MKATKDENVKTIRFPVKTDEKLQILANKSGLTKLDFFIHMVDYFYKSKKDPRDLNDELLKNAINKKTDNIVAFIKTQEQDLLIPMKKDSEKIVTVQGKIVDAFNQSVIRFNDEQRVINQSQAANMTKIAEYMRRIDLMQYDKAELKRKFMETLEFYNRRRDQMSMMTKQSEKDELIAHVRAEVSKL